VLILSLEIDWSAVANAFSTAFVIEVVAPKISGVSGVEGFKDLTTASMVVSSYYIWKSIGGLPSYAGCVPLGASLLNLITEVLNDPLVGTNTCLGYGLTAISLASAILYAIREGSAGGVEDLVGRGFQKLRVCLAEEPPDALLKAVSVAGPSYHGVYVTPRVFRSTYDVLDESSNWDLVAYNIVRGFKVSLELAELLRGVELAELPVAVGRVYRYAASRYVDSVCFKSCGLMASRLVKVLASSKGVDDLSLRRVLTSAGINLGSISDVVASSVALTLVERYLRGLRRS
jgi:hypothetical protein